MYVGMMVGRNRSVYNTFKRNNVSTTTCICTHGRSTAARVVETNTPLYNSVSGRGSRGQSGIRRDQVQHASGW